MKCIFNFIIGRFFSEGKESFHTGIISAILYFTFLDIFAENNRRISKAFSLD